MKLSNEIIEEIAKYLKKGNYVRDVINYLSIPESTYYAWKKTAKKLKKEIAKGEKKIDGLGEYGLLLIEFLEAVKKAEAEAVIKLHTVIEKAAYEGQWQAAAWHLERKHRKKWGRKANVIKTESNNIIIPDTAKKKLKKIFDNIDDE